MMLLLYLAIDMRELNNFLYTILIHGNVDIGGGSITLGSLDDVYRKCISQMAKLHFVETINHKKI